MNGSGRDYRAAPTPLNVERMVADAHWMRIASSVAIPTEQLPRATAASHRPVTPQLSAEQVELLADAKRRWERIGRAIAVARYHAWVVMALAVIIVAFGLFGRPAALGLGVALAVIARLEIRATGRLQRLDVSAAREQALNHLCLGAMLICFTTVRLATGSVASFGWSGALVAAVAIIQGCCATYSVTRRRHVVEFVNSTPPWILAMIRAGLTL